MSHRATRAIRTAHAIDQNISPRAVARLGSSPKQVRVTSFDPLTYSHERHARQFGSRKRRLCRARRADRRALLHVRGHIVTRAIRNSRKRGRRPRLRRRASHYRAATPVQCRYLLTPAAILHLHLNKRSGMDRPAVSRTPRAPSLQEANDEKIPDRFQYSARDRGTGVRAQTAGAWSKRQFTNQALFGESSSRYRSGVRESAHAHGLGHR